MFSRFVQPDSILPPGSITHVSNLRLYRSVFGCVAILLVIPMWITTYVPLTEFPIHLMRVYMMDRYEATPFFQETFALNHGVMPNLAIEFVAGTLMKIVDPLTAGRLFLTSIILLFAVGCHMLGRSIHGTPTWLAIPAAFLIYNAQLLYGFVNFCFGLGMFLIALAVWLRWRESRSPWLLVLCVALGAACYISHLSSFAFFAFATGVITMHDLVRKQGVWKQVVTGLFPLVVPVALHRMFMSSSGDLGEIVWSTMLEKISGIVSPFRSYSAIIDVSLMALIAAVIFWLIYKRSIGYRTPVLAWIGAAFFLFFILSPRVLFTSYSADVRFIQPAVLLSVLAMDIRGERIHQFARWGFLGIVILSTVRLTDIAINWVPMSAAIERQMTMVEKIDSNSLVYSIRYDDLLSDRKTERPLGHALTNGVLIKPMAVSNLPAFPSQQPLYWREPSQDGGRNSRDDSEVRIPWDTVRSRYRYVWVYDPKPALRAEIEQNAAPIDSTDNTWLFKIRS